MGERRTRRSLTVRPLLLSARRAADAILAVLLAPACVSCGLPLDAPLDGPVCAACWRAVTPLAAPLCVACSDPLPPWRTYDRAHARCGRCRRAPPAVARLTAAGAYDGTLRAAIHAMKYEGRRSLAVPLAALMRAAGSASLAGADVLVPVPLHRSRLRARGFNQAADLARALEPRGTPVAHLLRRRRDTAPQADLPAARRHGNVRDAFEATRDAGGWTGATVVLVDDVSTTGATLDACARALKTAGVREVRAVTAARAVRGRP